MSAALKSGGGGVTAKPVKAAPRFAVQKGVPIPPRIGGGRASVCPYPFLDMVRGDSFFVAASDHKAIVAARASVGNWARGFAKREAKGFRVVTRAVEGGLRCWRIE